ncbi:hypothetical protein VNO78_19854 [Psophocarpus tetragonolobus]|uniref:Uncharacterized protein n=1 Tax=Psophocarpus tetragonolobus TaxID=3891 RepID=A0AAN9S8D3_PSOTE
MEESSVLLGIYKLYGRVLGAHKQVDRNPRAEDGGPVESLLLDGLPLHWFWFWFWFSSVFVDPPSYNKRIPPKLFNYSPQENFKENPCILNHYHQVFYAPCIHQIILTI